MPINFTVMTWNLENLFPAGHAPGPDDTEAYERKMGNLASTILSIEPDVLAVQEVGAPAPFSDLQSRLGDHYMHALLSSHADARGIRVGFMSRLPVESKGELYRFPPGGFDVALRPRPNSPPGAPTDLPEAQDGVITHMGRGALKVTVALAQNLSVNLVTAHLKSKLITYSGGRRSPSDEDERARGAGLALLKRTAEVVALRVFTNALVTNNDLPLILLGDFNDGPEAVTTQLLLGPEDRSLSRRDKFDDVRLYNLAEYIDPARRYSRIYNKQPEMIDHIMVSHDLIFRHRQVDSYIEPIDSITESIETRRDASFPDHAPVFARFEIPEPG